MIRQARLPLRVALFVVVVLLAPVASAAGWSVAQQTAGAPLTPAEAARADAAIADAQARLPPDWRDAPALDVVIDWRDDLPDDVHGRTFGPHLRLRRALLNGDAAAPLQAALLHEFAHRYDLSLIHI